MSSPLSCGPPPPATIYPDISTAFAAIQAHAKDNGYAFIARDRKPTRVLYLCDRAVNYDNEGEKTGVNESNRRRQTSSKKTDCKMRATLSKDKTSDQWKFSVIDGEHNHAPSADFAAHPAHRLAAISAETRSQMNTFAKAGLSSSQILTTLRTQGIETTLTSKDVSNVVQKMRTEELNGMSPIWWLLQELEAYDYSPAYEPRHSHLRRLFFISPVSIELWKQHSDVLLLDCTYKTIRFHMPLLNICGMTGNNMVIQLGTCFLSGETEKDYEWALIQMGAVMSQYMIQEPISIVTDREIVLIECIDLQFPSVRHLLCRWHVNMNVLAKTKKYFPGPIKDNNGNWARHPRFQVFLISWNGLLTSTTEQQYDDRLQDIHIQFPSTAVSYIESTWLLWKEKLVAYWTDQSPHFGVTVTSPIEGCHATLKKYLQRGHGDLRGVFLKLKLFRENQQENIRVATASQQFQPKHSINKPLFAAVLHQVHAFVLLKINQEQSKLNENSQPPPNGCTCVIQQFHGLPCFHTIFQRERDHGCILLEDIHQHWWYNRPKTNDTFSSESDPLPLPILDPLKVKGKGRPKGALGGSEKGPGSRVAPSNTRRNPSFFELPSSSAPAALPSAGTPLLQQNSLSTTAHVMRRLADGHQDSYEPGTRRERAYMRGISSIYHTDSMEDPANLSAAAMTEAAVNDTLDFLESHDISDDDEEEGAGVAGVPESQLNDTDAPFTIDLQWMG